MAQSKSYCQSLQSTGEENYTLTIGKPRQEQGRKEELWANKKTLEIGSFITYNSES